MNDKAPKLWFAAWVFMAALQLALLTAGTALSMAALERAQAQREAAMDASVGDCVQTTQESLQACQWLANQRLGESQPLRLIAWEWYASGFVFMAGAIAAERLERRALEAIPEGEWDQRVYARVRGF